MDSEDGVNSLGSPTSQRHDHPSTSRPKQSAPATQRSPTGIEQARTYLQQFYNPALRTRDYEPEKIFICRISLGEWFGLREEFDLDGPRSGRRPRFSYNSATSTLKIYPMFSWLHETATNFVHEHFTLLLHQALPARVRNEIKIFPNMNLNGFASEYQGSSKVPDLGIFMRNNDDPMELKWALEVGFSEQYPDLQEDIRTWLIGQPTCSMAVLINITESPTYRCPLDFDLDICDELNMPQDPSQVREGDFSLQGEYGPVEFKGCQWVGQISEIFLEIWTRNPRTGQPRRRGGRMSIIPPTTASPQFQLADFLSIDDPQMTSFNWDEFRTQLKDCLRTQAAERYREWLDRSKERAGLVGDRA